ncbi:MAG: type II toxin-antitoxin system RatA family toxin [Gammaproteobacteria bacterium]|nr:type II toxin-antitoxin system RatA family toxin [Gammaproteobacteria bacterium]
MYKLVNDIEAYPEFLPWCNHARVFNRTDKSLNASVSLATGKIRQSFSTENTMEFGKRIDVKLISGPFKYLTGYWEFLDIGDNRCQIKLNMEFEFKNKLLKLTLKSFFNQFIDSLVGAFADRAKIKYP